MGYYCDIYSTHKNSTIYSVSIYNKYPQKMPNTLPIIKVVRDATVIHITNREILLLNRAFNKSIRRRIIRAVVCPARRCIYCLISCFSI